MDANSKLVLLDTVLNFTTTETTYGNLRDNFENHKEEMRSMVRKLQKDGYVELVNPNGNKELINFNITGFQSEWLVKRTFEGDLFVDAGAYVQQQTDNKIISDRTESQISSGLFYQRWIFVATIIMAIYYFVEMLKYFGVIKLLLRQ
jgi:hypothetical protein